MTKRTGSRAAGHGPPRKVKIAITLSQEQVAEAHRAVQEGRASSVSAYIAQALEQATDADALARLISLMRADDGPPSAADYAWADAALGLRRSRSAAR